MVPVCNHQFDEMVERLRGTARKQLKRFMCVRCTLEELIHCSVAGNTLRSFQRLPEKPSVIFRTWANATLNGLNMRLLARAESQEEFDAFHEKLRASLSEYWHDQAQQPLKFGPGLKLINLLLKSVVRHSKIDDEERERLISFLHVPLDKYSLGAICLFSNDPRYVSNPIWISPSASMGFVDSRKTYRLIQQVMREVATAAGVPRICVDLLAWDLAHS